MTKTEGVVACEVCLKEIPKSVAQSHEGTEYVYHFCGAECYQEWLAAPAMQEVALTVCGVALDFETAQALAKIVATRREEGAMLLAWWDRVRGRESPQVPECQHKPGWLAYAESHGGDLRVSINSGDYVFIFRSVSVAA
jgi:hypothetical protein